MATRPPPDLKLGKQPPADDVEANVHFFMDMLDAFGQAGTPDYLKIRGTLIDIIAEYRDSDRGEEARSITKAKMLGAEMGVVEVLAKNTAKIRDKFAQESRKLSDKTREGQIARLSADGLTLLVDGLKMFEQAVQHRDEGMREEAKNVLMKAQEILGRVAEQAKTV